MASKEEAGKETKTMMWLMALGVVIVVVASVIWMWVFIGDDIDDIPFKGL